MGVGLALLSHKNLPATETTTKELTSAGMRSKACKWIYDGGGPKLRGGLKLDSRSPDAKTTFRAED